MKMDLQKFAEEGNQGQQENEGQEQQTQQPNENNEQENKGSSNKLNEKLSNAIKQFQGMNKKMKDFFDNQSNSNESSQEKKPTEKPKESSKGSQSNEGSDYEERIANLEKQLHDQQSKSQQNDLNAYAKSQIKSKGFNVDDDTFNLIKGDSKEGIDANLSRYSNLAKKLNANQPPKQPNSNNNGKPKQENLGAELAKGANAQPKGLESYFK